MYENEELTLVYRTFSMVESSDARWLWYPYLPRGKIVLLTAKPGTGKTFLSLYLCSVLSNGGPFLDEPVTKRRIPEGVVYQTAEDGVGDTLKKRLEMIKPSPIFENIYNVDESQHSLSLAEPEEIECILKAIRPAMMVFDPLQAYLGKDVDMHRANQVRPVLARIGALAEQYDCTMLFIMHTSKMQQGNAMYGALGSVDIPAVARSMLLLDSNPQNENELLLAHIKSSLSKPGQSILYHLDDGNPVFDGYSDLTGDEVYLQRTSKRRAVSFDKAVELLRNALAEQNGYLNCNTVNEMAKRHNISLKTFQRAKKELKLTYIKVGYANPQAFWVSPELDPDQVRRHIAETTTF